MHRHLVVQAISEDQLVGQLHPLRSHGMAFLLFSPGLYGATHSIVVVPNAFWVVISYSRDRMTLYGVNNAPPLFFDPPEPLHLLDLGKTHASDHRRRDCRRRWGSRSSSLRCHEPRLSVLNRWEERERSTLPPTNLKGSRANKV